MKVRISPETIYDYLPYLNDHIADVRRNGMMSAKGRKDLDNHKASAIIDFFDFATNIPEMPIEFELKFCEKVARNFEKGWVTEFDTETGLENIISTGKRRI